MASACSSDIRLPATEQREIRTGVNESTSLRDARTASECFSFEAALSSGVSFPPVSEQTNVRFERKARETRSLRDARIASETRHVACDSPGPVTKYPFIDEGELEQGSKAERIHRPPLGGETVPTAKVAEDQPFFLLYKFIFAWVNTKL